VNEKECALAGNSLNGFLLKSFFSMSYTATRRFSLMAGDGLDLDLDLDLFSDADADD